MKIRVSARNVLPLMLLLTLYAGGTLYLAERILPCGCAALDGSLRASMLERGVEFLTSFSSRGQFGSWIGNSWAPGSFGWTTQIDTPSIDTPPTVEADVVELEAVDCEDPPGELGPPTDLPVVMTGYGPIPFNHVSIVVVAPQLKVEPAEGPFVRTISTELKAKTELEWCRQIS